MSVFSVEIKMTGFNEFGRSLLNRPFKTSCTTVALAAVGDLCLNLTLKIVPHHVGNDTEQASLIGYVIF